MLADENLNLKLSENRLDHAQVFHSPLKVIFFPIYVFHYIPLLLFIVECHKNQHQSEILSPETNSTCVEGQCIMVLSQLKLPKLCFKLVPFSRPAEVECTCEQCNA